MPFFSQSLIKKGLAALLTMAFAALLPTAALAAPAPAAPVMEELSGPASEQAALAEKIIAHGKTHLGEPYVFGDEGPNAWDCSSFVQHVYGHYGYDLPRVSKNQAKVGIAVDESELAPGDLLFYKDTWTKGVSHVGIYIGDGKILHAWPKGGVKISSIDSKYLRSHYWGARRVIGVMNRTAN